MDILQQFHFHFELRNCPIQYILKTQILSFYFLQMMVKCMEKTGQYTIKFKNKKIAMKGLNAISIFNLIISNDLRKY